MKRKFTLNDVTTDFFLNLAAGVALILTALQLFSALLKVGDARALISAFSPESRAQVFIETGLLLTLVVVFDIPSRLRRCARLRSQAELLVWSQFAFGFSLMLAPALAALGRAGIAMIGAVCVIFATVSLSFVVGHLIEIRKGVDA